MAFRDGSASGVDLKIENQNEIQSKTMGTTVQRHWFQQRWFWMVISVVLSCSYTFYHLQTGWMPWDEGQLAQSAERVLSGEIPHRDFDEMYTGGLTYLNAIAFQSFGIRCESTRWMLWLFFIPFSCSIFWLTARACPPAAAGLVTFTVGATSLPVYSAAMPSWYNLYFLTFGLVALVKFIETEKRRWLVLAGLFAGISMLFKITGLFWLAAAILFVVYFEQTKSSPHKERSVGFDLFVIGALMLFASAGLKFCGITESGIDDGLNFTHLWVPILAVSLFLSAGQLCSARGGFKYRLARLVGFQTPLLCGAAIPIVAWLAFYASLGGLNSLYEGVFLLPLQRLGLGSATYAFPGWPQLLIALPFTGLFTSGLVIRKTANQPQVWWVGAGVALTIALWIAASQDVFYWQLIFQAFRNCLPWLVIAALGYLYFAPAHLERRYRLELFSLIAAVVTGSLIQYPYSIEIYFLYIAPVVMVAMVYLIRFQPTWSKAIQVTLLAGFAVTATFKMSSAFPDNNTMGVANPNAAKKLQLNRCSMIVPEFDVDVYHRLIQHIHQLTDSDAPIFAGPDCPEVYFLSERRNPTRIIYDFFRPEIVSKPQKLVQDLLENKVKLIVLRQEVAFSKLNRKLEAEAEKYYPDRYDIYRRDPYDHDRQQLIFTILHRPAVTQPEGSGSR